MACTINDSFSCDGANIDSYMIDNNSDSSQWSDFRCDDNLNTPENISYTNNSFNACNKYMCNTIKDVERKYNFDHSNMFFSPQNFSNYW